MTTETATFLLRFHPVWLGHRPRLPLSPTDRAESFGDSSGFERRPRMEGPGKRQASAITSSAKWRSGMDAAGPVRHTRR